MTLPDTLIPQATALLLPQMSASDEREAWLTQAFYITERRLYTQIDRGGVPIVFVTRLIKTLLDFGCLPGGSHALSLLLNAVRLGSTPDVQARIDALIPTLDLLCVDGSSSDIETPVESPTLPIQTLATPADQRTPTVFISYSRRDEAFARKLMTDLQQSGHACWIDTTAIKGGDEWVRAITEGINNSYAFVSIISDAANESKWVRREYLWAEDKGKLILPILSGGMNLPIYMIDRHAISLHPDYMSGLQHLIAALPKPTIPQADTTTISVPVIAAPNQRALELEYLDRLRLEELLNTERYTPMAGTAQVAAKQDSVRSVTIRPEFEHLRGKFAQQERETRRFEDIIGAIDTLRRAVVLGEPGGGKTTTLWKLASNLLTAAFADPAAPIPVLVRLSKWTDKDQPLNEFICSELGGLGNFLDNLLTEKRAALLLDGLNELPVAQREDKSRQIKALFKAHPDLISVVSCREQDYTVDLSIDKIAITPLDPLRIREFVTRYLGEERGDVLFWRLAGEEAMQTFFTFKRQFSARVENWETIFWIANELPNDIRWGFNNAQWQKWCDQRDHPNSLLTLARNPYMLLMMTEVFTQTGNLPTNRGQLFAGFVETLMRREGISSEESEELTYNLWMLAYMMQFRRMGGAMGGVATVVGPSGETERVFKLEKDKQEKDSGNNLDAVTSVPREAVSMMFANDSLLYTASSASLLTVSGDTVRFSHQLLQEYFLALYLQHNLEASNAMKIWPPDVWWRRNNWEEATILLAGLFADDCTPVLNWVSPANPEVAAQCVLRSGAKTPRATLDRFREMWIPRLTDLEDDPQPQARAAVGRAIGLLGLDTRSGVGVRADGLPDISWCEIRDGEFTFQSDQLMTLPRFYVAKYPITFCQFQTFVDAPDGFANDAWWDGLAKRSPELGEQAFKYNNHPRDRINWYDAMGFCRWLSSKLGYEVRLPTEQEWEKAARGTDRRLFAYGNDFDQAKGNTQELDLGGTTAVGIFPQGASPYGAMDMTGNVFEWTLPDPSTKLGMAGTPVNKQGIVRGGSWFRGKDVATTTSRTSLSLNDRYSSVGFRVMAVKPAQ